MRVQGIHWRLFNLWGGQPAAAQKVARDYATIGLQHPQFLADIALAGGVFRNHDPKADGPLEYFNGRRELALEIIKACKIPASDLYALIPTKPREDRS